MTTSFIRQTIDLPTDESALQVLYEGWKAYRRKQRGWQATPSIADIQDWESYLKMVEAKLQENLANGTAKQI